VVGRRQACWTARRTKAVDEQIVPVILPEDLDLRALVFDRKAEQEKSKLGDCERTKDDGDSLVSSAAIRERGTIIQDD
jgi:hypothetical protein